MKIATKIDKPTYTRLNKLNLKYLMGDIDGQQGDLTIEANYLAEDWKPLGSGNPGIDKLSEEWLTTLNGWHKDVKANFKSYKRDAIKIQKAYDRFLEAKAKKAKK